MENLNVREKDSPVLTIGHSNHGPDVFVALLREHGVDVVVDVRSAPYSRYLPHFNKDFLQEALAGAGIRYEFKGKELGGQPADRTYYDADGRVMYDALAGSAAFKHGIEFVLDAASVHPSTGSGRTDAPAVRHLALMCSEKEPLDCHRTLLIAQTLAKSSVAVAHIHADGSLENHAEALNRLLDSFKLPHNGDLFRSREEVIADAVARQAQRVGARWRETPAL
jgi:uncharacterized protein (DUF488 family)